ncbi:hypothetical protein THOM_2812 [Trachipleistophora hominis]|uniref:Uncharacterized protein n=1 Tax=Trachipleistophora hominis TaxID=72359 RepID=L7JS27_TRAHO|nr:hypothetical protein THOM_2812 [Trachipleistophora hominis]
MLKKNNRIARITDQDDFELLDNDRLGNVLDDNEIIVCYNCSETEDSEEKDMNENNEPEKRRVQVSSVNKTSESESAKKEA